VGNRETAVPFRVRLRRLPARFSNFAGSSHLVWVVEKKGEAAQSLHPAPGVIVAAARPLASHFTMAPERLLAFLHRVRSSCLACRTTLEPLCKVR